jgi:hypothetical protein
MKQDRPKKMYSLGFFLRFKNGAIQIDPKRGHFLTDRNQIYLPHPHPSASTGIEAQEEESRSNKAESEKSSFTQVF